jgi:hypothetical protein
VFPWLEVRRFVPSLGLFVFAGTVIALAQARTETSASETVDTRRECESDAGCDDQNVCTFDECVNNTCVHLHWDPCCQPDGPCPCRIHLDCVFGWCCDVNRLVCKPPPCLGDGDFNGDGLINLEDWRHWDHCDRGPAGSWIEGECNAFNLDGNHTIDLVDFAALQQAFTP